MLRPSKVMGKMAGIAAGLRFQEADQMADRVRVLRCRIQDASGKHPVRRFHDRIILTKELVKLLIAQASPFEIYKKRYLQHPPDIRTATDFLDAPRSQP